MANKLENQWVERLIQRIYQWRRRRIVVVGDFLLDHHVFGHADRLSPDAPVPVLSAHREEFRPGGAANVCLDLRALRCDVVCLGVVGRDANADTLTTALKAAGCLTGGLIRCRDRPTTVKHNFIGLAQHRHANKMFRVDEECIQDVPRKIEQQLIARAQRALKGADVLCLEDYNKGVLTSRICQSMIKLARAMKIPVIVDPANIKSYDKYRAATCVTPNRFEAAIATGLEGNGNAQEQQKMARKLLVDLKLKALVLTLDKHGALLLEKGKRPQPIPTRTRSVYDVTGAGDMILAVLAAAVANDANWHEALLLANIAAGLEVERFGIVPIDLDEILLTLLQASHETVGKVRSLEELLPELQAHRRMGKTIAFTNGCFDILHAGHIGFLREASHYGDLLVVAVNSDASIRRIKGSDRPVNREVDRLMVLSELQSVDYLTIFHEDTAKKLIRAIKPDVMIKGADYKKSGILEADDVKQCGGRVVLVDLLKGRSTTNIIRKITRSR